MRVTANGKMVDLPSGATIGDLLERLGLAGRPVVVERNGEVVPRAQAGWVVLGEGDRLEVVRPVQGGAQPGAREALDRSRLYLVCDLRFDAPAVSRAIDGGVGVVQLRDKHASDVQILSGGGALREVTAHRGIPFIVNDRPDLCRALGADGVHLGQDDLPPLHAREQLGPGVIIGRSTHSVEQIDVALAEHHAGLVDYIAVGPVHPTPTKQGRPAVGHELVEYAARRVDCPWFAIGGIDVSNVGRVAAAGAVRIVVVRAITGARDPCAAASALVAGLTGMPAARDT